MSAKECQEFWYHYGRNQQTMAHGTHLEFNIKADLGGFWFKTAEWKDVHSSPFVRTPKLQLAVEQPSAGGCWKPPERYPMSKDKEEAAARWEKGGDHDNIKSHTHQVGDPQTGEQECQSNWQQDCQCNLSLLWRFGTSRQAFQPGDPTKGLGIPRESGRIWL